MKILLTHRYYTPDTPPYALMLHAVARDLHKAGHDVQVFTTAPSYKTAAGIKAPARETLDGVKVHRIKAFSENSASPLRVLNALWYCARLFFKVLSVRPDAVQAATFPPVIAAWSAGLAAKLVGARFVYHMQDIHPEVSMLSKGVVKRRLSDRVFTWLDQGTLKRAASVVVLSQDMKDTLLRRGVDYADKIEIINNFQLEPTNAPATPPSVEPMSNGELNVIFAGNIGNFQGLDAVIAAAQGTSDIDGLHYWFLGEGAAKARLMEQAGALVNRTVFFAPFRPAAEAAALIQKADLGLASLSPGIHNVSYPSKVLTYLGLGTPVFACIEAESELARTVTTERIGASAPPGDVEAIEKELRGVWAVRHELPEWSKNADALYRKRFSFESAARAWRKIYAD